MPGFPFCLSLAVCLGICSCKPEDVARINQTREESRNAEVLYQELSVELAGLGSEMQVAGGNARVIADETAKLRVKQNRLQKQFAAAESVNQSITAQTEALAAALAEFKKKNP